MTALVLTFGAKAFNDKELCKACLAGGNTTVISTRETNKNVTVRFLKIHMAYVNFTSLFSSLCSTVAHKIYNFLKTKHIAHIACVAAIRTRSVKILHTQANVAVTLARPLHVSKVDQSKKGKTKQATLISYFHADGSESSLWPMRLARSYFYDVTIHPSRGSRINPTLKVCEHNRVAYASQNTSSKILNGCNC